MKSFIKRNKKLVRLVSIITISLAGLIAAALPAEGMFPMSEVHKIDLVKAGLQMDPDDLYNPNGVSLIDALVKIGGCTGSFVSEEGLIITNHHCGFRAVSNASTPEQNYLENGFTAKTKIDEIPAQGYTVRIMESYEDVSDKILAAAAEAKTLSERAKIISKKMRSIAQEANDSEKSIVASVSEMFIGQTYVLFKYRIIKDVRLVYAPPRAIGEFGGETDNWMWPRHTGDFTFMRAYVAKDGSAAEYSKDNVPFKPKRWLKVNANGVKENDFAFIVGYPGRTFRHRPSQFLAYQENFQLPYISGLYGFMIDQLEDISKDDTALQLKYAPYIKGLANTMKNYRGKLLGIRRLNLVEKKVKEEKLLQEFIQQNSELKEKYGTLLTDIETVYGKMFDYAEADLWFSRLRRLSRLAQTLGALSENFDEMSKPESERISPVKRESFIKKTSAAIDLELEKRLMIKMLTDAKKFKNASEIKALKNISDIEGFVAKIASKDFLSEENISKLMKLNLEEAKAQNSEIINFMIELKNQYLALAKELDQIDGSVSALMPKLTEVKKLWKKSSFIPDANSTLRLTYGYIKGYSPKDATWSKPFTTLDGLIDKSLWGNPEYKIPYKLKELYEAKDFGRFYDKDLGSVPVALLYNMDTTGGNSGSPILNAKGELIGVNFDRAYEATINDYAWNESYSRSIGVDIRYCLWVTEKIGDAGHLLTEMGVN